MPGAILCLEQCLAIYAFGDVLSAAVRTHSPSHLLLVLCSLQSPMRSASWLLKPLAMSVHFQ